MSTDDSEDEFESKFKESIQQDNRGLIDRGHGIDISNVTRIQKAKNERHDPRNNKTYTSRNRGMSRSSRNISGNGGRTSFTTSTSQSNRHISGGKGSGLRVGFTESTTGGGGSGSRSSYVKTSGGNDGGSRTYTSSMKTSS